MSTMDRTFKVQLPGQMTVMAWQPKSASRRQGMDNSRSILGSSRVSCCGLTNGPCRLGFSLSPYSSGIHEPHSRSLQSIPCSSSSSSSSSIYSKHERRAKRRVLACAVVLNEVGQSSSQVPPGPASPDELKDQLEALQDEAFQVRNRYNNARARFMRLTEVAQQLRQRAALDLNLGNEDGARKALLEKQKVIQAAELSQKRAQLLKELSTKLGEVASVKETQLIVALSRPPQEEPTVRVVSPKADGSSSVNLDLDNEGSPRDSGAVETSQFGQEATESDDPAASGEDSGDVLIEKEEESFATELGYSTSRHLNSNEEDVEANDSLQGAASGLNRDVDEQSIKGSPKSGESHNGSEEMGRRDTSLDGGGLLEQNDGREGTREVGFHYGRSRFVERLMLDVLNQVEGLELRLGTALNGNMDTNDMEVQLVRDLLEQVQSLRARISEAARLLTQQETQ